MDSTITPHALHIWESECVSGHVCEYHVKADASGTWTIEKIACPECNNLLLWYAIDGQRTENADGSPFGSWPIGHPDTPR